MANQQVGNAFGVAASGIGGANNPSNVNGRADNSPNAGPYDANTNEISIANMRTRLAAISGTTYTAAVLDMMTTNDMLYALRVNDFASTVQ